MSDPEIPKVITNPQVGISYPIKTLIHNGLNSQVYRIQSSSDQPAQILKVLNSTYPTPRQIKRYQHEFKLSHQHQLSGVIKSYALEDYQSTLAIIFEDINGTSLKNWAGQQPVSVATFLPIAIQVVDCLAQLHSIQVIHKDLNPDNIVINPEKNILKLIDLGISSQFKHEMLSMEPPSTLEGTLAYISPEQTGRMNRALDYRTDYYSIGITFYELLSGHLPFGIHDPLEVIHCHLAEEAPPLHTLDLGIPQSLSDIIQKLMAKNAEDRYQSSLGIQSDLKYCWEQWQATKMIPTFSLACLDIPERFQVSQKLYGREQTIQTLLQAFEEISSTATLQSQFILIAGYSGIGKSSLVQELYKPISQKRAYFTSGKFDQFQRTTPYSAIVEAFSRLIQQVLTESESQLQQWRESLIGALGTNSQVIINVIPALELIVGAQPPSPTLAPAESQNRFNRVFQQFVRVLSCMDHPLVLFLDDLQWADTASLKLLQLVLSDPQMQSLLIIGAYRSNEVHETHPLMRTLATLKQDGIEPQMLYLDPLNLSQIAQLLADTLDQTTETVYPLAQLILGKTGGNPFFINEFLKTLEAEHLIVFDPSIQTWNWSLAQIESQQITDNVVDLMTAKLQKLSQSVQHLLCYAACIGPTFDLPILSLVADQTPTEISQILEPALLSGLILQKSQARISQYSFLHDRVQQAAYELVRSDQKVALHLRIGQLLQQQLSQNPDTLFEVVDHLNLGSSLLEPREKQAVAQLNLEAGTRAKQATAYQAAEHYLSAGVSYLSDDQSLGALRYSLLREWAEVQYLLGQFEASKMTIDCLLSCDLTARQLAEVYSLLIVQYTIQTNYQAALVAGQEALAALGITLPLTDVEAAFETEYAKLQAVLGSRLLPSLEHLPPITNPDQIFAVELLSNLGSAAYRYDRRIWQLIVAISINLFLEHGNVPQSCYGYSNYGTLLGSVLGDYQAGYESALLSLRLSQRYQNRTQTARACFILGNFVQSWVRPVSEAEAINQMGVDAGLETGEFQYVGYTLSYRITNLFFQGKPLFEVMPALQEALRFCQRLKNQWAIDSLLGYQVVIEQLSGAALDQPSLTEAEYVEACTQHKSFSGLCRYYILQGIAYYLNRQPHQALTMLEKATPLLDFILGVVSVAEHSFFEALVLAELTSDSSHPRLQQALKRLDHWSQTCPHNFLQKAQLIEAEQARIEGAHWKAAQLYDEAISNAKAHGFLQDEAIACERAALFWLNHQKADFAETYLLKAHYAFNRWGALQKGQQMEAQFPWLDRTQTLNRPSSILRSPSDVDPIQITTSTENEQLSERIDLSTVIKASQVLSGELVLDHLIAKLMKIVLENAGAQKGYLLLPTQSQPGALAIEAESTVKTGTINLLQSIPLDQLDPTTQLPLLPSSIVNYVSRTQKGLVLNDGAHEDPFTHDPYILAVQPKSVLCTPLVNQGRLTGMVYLENNLTAGAFTVDRINVLNMLCSQAAISIESSRLYHTLERKVTERTAELALANQEISRLNEQLSVENQRMSTELEVTRQLQQMIVPSLEELSAIPDLDIAGYMEPASEVGGDYYDVLVDQGRIKLGIGDVTGHGLQSGVIMLMVQTAVRTLLVAQEEDPIQFMSILNRVIYDNVQRMATDKNLTLSLVDYQDQTLKLYGNHEELLVIRQDGSLERIDTIDLGMPIGLLEDIREFVNHIELRIDPGDVVVLYTDGVTEARNSDKKMYGLPRLCEVVRSHRELPSHQIQQTVIQDLQDFIGTQAIRDDITLVVVKLRSISEM